MPGSAGRCGSRRTFLKRFPRGAEADFVMFRTL